MNFRQGDKVGGDYKCGKCGRHGCRLWRDTHVCLIAVELLCAECAEQQEAEAIKQYAKWHQETDPTIGNLVPARAVPDGDTFWGHTSGDMEWWYKLPQFADPKREERLLRLERDHFVDCYQQGLRDWLEEIDKRRELQKQLQAAKESKQ